jgi:3-deoxy-manno-octulosonate cytidylyltransferase (CMP-KDO synthetase)
MFQKEFHIIIPARYASSRFPGKPLVDIFGKTMIQHVYERASAFEKIKSVTVATDDQRILDTVIAFGGKTLMTAATHQSGTDRIAEAMKTLKIPINEDTVIINLQGDEPFIQVNQIALICEICEKQNAPIATLAKEISEEEDFQNPNVVKLVKTKQNKALYFSRSAIPYLRADETSAQRKAFRHLGIYAYQTAVLQQLSQLPESDLELSERLEQLRWLENGYEIFVGITDYQSPAVDTPEDLKKIIAQGGFTS